MNYLTAENISKAYGEKVLFDELDLLINKGDKIALIAKNGTGKSTLLKILAGLDSSDKQHRIIYHDITVGYLQQEPTIDPEQNLLEYILDNKNPKIQAYANLLDAQKTGDKKKLNRATLKIDDLNAWDTGAKIDEILAKFNFDDPGLSCSILSGGQKKRLSLAKLILEENDLMILDEPTNHLDVKIIDWLEEYLKHPQITLLMVTHDRYFLENVCEKILELENGELQEFPGNYSTYLEQKETMIEIQNTRAGKMQKLLKSEREWMSRSPKARTAKSKSRIGNVENIKEEAQNVHKTEELEFYINTERLGGKIVEFHDVGFQYPDKTILNDFSYKFSKKEKVALVGANGVGKSTFLKLLTGELEPTKGKIVIGKTVKFGYYYQQGLQPKKDKRIIDILREVGEYIPLEKGKKLRPESLLERFLFPRSQHRVYYSQLSGGEKRRLYLLYILMHNPNFLILDEPTNDLDIQTLSTLEDFLESYPGCLILVTHDRFMTDKLADHLFILEGDGEINDYNGSYSNYLEKEQKKNTSNSGNKNDNSKKQSNNNYQQKKQTQRAIQRIEKQLAKLEKEKDELEQSFLNPDLSVDELVSKQKELDQLEAAIDEKEEEWFALNEEV